MSVATLALVAQAVPYGVGRWVMIAIVVAAVLGIGVVVCRQMGVTIPPFVVTIFWIVVAAVVGIAAIRFVLTL